MTEDAVAAWADANRLPLAEAVGLPGVPMRSPMRRLTDAQQAIARAQCREVQRAIEPFISDVERCHRHAAAMAVTAVIG